MQKTNIFQNKKYVFGCFNSAADMLVYIAMMDPRQNATLKHDFLSVRNRMNAHQNRLR